MKFSTCHPERKHMAKGLCYICYHKKWYNNRVKTDPNYRQQIYSWPSNKNRFRHNRIKGYKTKELEAHFNKKYQEQNGICAICKEKSNKRLHIDHDHSTNALRDLLCFKCNAALGMVNDSPKKLQDLIFYLHRFNKPLF